MAADETSFHRAASELAQLETFDPAAFRAGADVPQSVCNLVLSLALVYNDCKNLIAAHTALTKARPSEEFRRTRVWGALLGEAFHHVRSIFGLVHELFKLIEKN